MRLNQLLQEKRQEILTIAAKHGAYNVRIFGSVARGEADEASDVDILVECEPETHPVSGRGADGPGRTPGLRGRCCYGEGFEEKDSRKCAKEAVPYER